MRPGRPLWAEWPGQRADEPDRWGPPGEGALCLHPTHPHRPRYVTLLVLTLRV